VAHLDANTVARHPTGQVPTNPAGLCGRYVPQADTNSVRAHPEAAALSAHIKVLQERMQQQQALVEQLGAEAQVSGPSGGKQVQQQSAAVAVHAVSASRSLRKRHASNT